MYGTFDKYDKWGSFLRLLQKPAYLNKHAYLNPNPNSNPNPNPNPKP